MRLVSPTVTSRPNDPGSTAAGRAAPGWTVARADRSRSPVRADPTLTRLYRLDVDDAVTRTRRATVRSLRPRPEQEPYSSRAEVTLPAADADPHRTPFVVEHDGVPVGFGVIDRAGNLPQLVDRPEQAALLRAFYIDANAQHLGHGRTAARLLPAFVRSIEPSARILVLTVNESNPAAIRAYTAGGFVVVGQYLGGSLGPQRIMVAALERAR